MSSDNAPKPIPSENQFSVTDFLSLGHIPLFVSYIPLYRTAICGA